MTRAATRTMNLMTCSLLVGRSKDLPLLLPSGLGLELLEALDPVLLSALIREQMPVRHLRPLLHAGDRRRVELRIGHRHLGDEHRLAFCALLEMIALDDLRL